MSEEYSLKKSADRVGQLYPVILSKDGKVIDGFHRLDADPKWRTETRDSIDSQEKLLKARLISNKFRRQVEAWEVEEWINELAEIALNEKNIQPGEISGWIAEETGYSQRQVNFYLESKYKLDYSAREYEKKMEPTAISVELDAIDALGANGYEQLEQEIEKRTVEKMVKSPPKKVVDKVREDLMKDPDEIIKIVERAPMVLPTLKPKPVTSEGYYKPALTQREAEQLSQAYQETQEDRKRRLQDPESKERARWVKAWMSLGQMIGVIDNVFCPICGSDSNNLVWKCHPETTLKSSLALVKKRLETK